MLGSRQASASQREQCFLTNRFGNRWLESREVLLFCHKLLLVKIVFGWVRAQSPQIGLRADAALTIKLGDNHEPSTLGDTFHLEHGRECALGARQAEYTYSLSR